ncbi:YdeI family protein [Massilia sp. ST3]|uniref:YdeI/OmpD-associated family protein n=1 Tax=Massilia sp. ST3 TaxID=2824903 RepID=UPI001B832E0A|nr:YdeI/OmpD-associated family protein [Massilia sp. ST3]MBQ5947677.1 YdeI/OmpD-associated family protein [Massilia sp. ST3]
MPTIDPRIDDYIANSAEFAQPILRHLRQVVHETCPDVEETIKWSMPFFLYQGMLCNMASFKAHCAFGFWKGELLVAQEDDKGREAMGQFGRIASLKDLPSKKTMAAYVKKAMALNTEGVQAPARAKPNAARELVVPDYFLAALEDKAGAREHFEAFSPSAKREYVDWLLDAKTEPTRLRRLEQAVEWIAEGKQRNWKYQNC